MTSNGVFHVPSPLPVQDRSDECDQIGVGDAFREGDCGPTGRQADVDVQQNFHEFNLRLMSPDYAAMEQLIWKFPVCLTSDSVKAWNRSGSPPTSSAESSNRLVTPSNGDHEPQDSLSSLLEET